MPADMKEAAERSRRVPRVLHVVPSFGIGGAERIAVQLLCGFAQRGYEVAAVSLYDPIGTELEIVLQRRSIPVYFLCKRPGFDIRMYAALQRTVKEFAPDVIHTHQYVLPYVVPVARWNRVPRVIHTVHTMAEREVNRMGQWFHRAAFRLGVTPVAVASEIQRSLERVYGGKKFPLIRNGIEVGRFQVSEAASRQWRHKEGFAEDDILFVSVGRLAKEKNVRLLIESFLSGPALERRAHLVLVGDGQLRRELESFVAGTEFANRVHFLGSRMDIPAILAAADVFVLASDREGNPLAVMEAMAAGLPVICSAVGGIPELVDDGVQGILVAPGRREQLASAMSLLLESEETRRRMGHAAAVRARERFDVKQMVDAYESLYTRS